MIYELKGTLCVFMYFMTFVCLLFMSSICNNRVDMDLHLHLELCVETIRSSLRKKNNPGKR